MLSEMMNKRVFGRMASLVMLLLVLSLAFDASSLIAAPFGVLEEPKPTESKDKDKEKDKKDDAPKDEDADEEKDSSDDKKDADAKDDASKDEKKEDLDKERERVAEESEAEKQKALDNLSKTPGGQEMSAAEKAEMEAQLEALKQAAIKSVGKTPPPAPKKATVKPPATKPADNMNTAKKPGTTFEETEAGKRIRRKIGPRGGLPKVADVAAKDDSSASRKNTKGNRRDLMDTSKVNPEMDPNSNAEDVGEPKTAEQKRQEAIEKAQQRAKDRRADIEAKRRDKMNAILDRGKNDRDNKKPSSTKRPRVGKRGRSKVDVDVEDAADDDDSSVQSPIGEIPAVFIDIKMQADAGREFMINYEETPWMDVVADFARMSRLPFVRNLDDEIEGTLTYFSTEKFSYDGAFHKLNELLFDRPLNNLVIQRLNDRITVVRIPDLLKAIPKDRIFGSFAEFKAANLDPYVACQTQYVPPVGFTPFQIIERYRPLFSDTYGVKISDPDRLELTGFAKEHIYFDEMIRHLTSIENPDEIDKYVTIQLNYAKANDVLTILRQLYPIQGAAAPPAKRGGRRGRRQPQANTIAPDLEDADAVNIITEAKANILYIKAPDYLMKELRSRIAELDVPTESRPEMELVELTHADASTVVSQVLPILQSIGPRMTKSPDFVDPKEQAKYDVTLFPSANGNGIVIVGGREGIEFVRQLVLNQFDVPPDWITKSIGLQHRDASYIVERLNEAMPSSGGSPTAVRRGKKGGPAIVATVDQPPSITIVSSRSLFVSASRFDMAMIEDLVQKLDVVDPEEPSEHFVYVRCATPSEIAETVQQIMAEDSTPTVAQPPAAKNAKARAAARRRAARASRGRSVQSGGDGPMIIPNDADQSLLVYCSDPDWVEVQRLIDRLESNACDVEPQWVQIKLERAEPTDIATYINQMFPAPGGSVQSVTADSFNKTINIYATPMFIEKVRPLIEKIDYTSTGELTIIKLMWAKAEIIAPIIQQAVPESQYVSPTARINAATAKTRRGKTPPKQAQRRIVQSAGDTAVRIVAEPVTNSLLVTAPPEKLRTIEDLVSQMEAVAESQRPEKVIVNVINRKADEIAGVLSSILNATQGAGGKEGAAGGSVNPTDVELSITAIGDQLILFGPQNEVAEAIQLVTQIDTLDAMPITRKVRVYDAEEDEKKLRSMLALKADTAISVSQAPQRGGRRAANRRAPTKPTAKLTDTGATVSDVQIYANPYENTLLIRAMPKDWKLIDEILDVIRDDAPPIPGSEEYESMFIVNLKHKSAWDISYDLEDVINVEGRRPVTFKEGPQEKTLIVMNFRPSQREEIEKWIEIYDVPKDGIGYGTGSRRVSVKNMPAGMAARLLKQQAGGEVPIEIVELGSGSKVITIDIHEGEVDEEDSVPAERTKADRGAKAEPVSALPSTSLPVWMRDVICAVAMGQADDDDSRKAPMSVGDPRIDALLNPPTDGIQVIVDPDTGELILIGDEELVSKYQDMLEDIMGDEKEEPVMRIFPLKYAPVSEAAAKLNEIFNAPAQRTVQRGRNTRQQQLQQQLQQQQQQGKGDEKGGKGKQPVQQQAPATPARIKVIPDERTSSVFVVAPLKEIPLITEVLRHLDSKRILDVNMRMYEMKNLDASQVVENLKEVLGIEDRPLTRAPQRGRGAANQRAQQQVQIQGDDGDTLVSADKVKLTAESQTNTIIAQGPPDTLDLIEGIIKDLEDKTIKSDVEMLRIVLRKARASEIADIVQSLIDETINNQNATPAAAPQRGRGRGRTPAAASRRNENVSVHADPRTNSVILAGPGDQLEKAKAIVEELDNTEVGLVIRQIPVKGEATEIANTLRTLFIGSGPRASSPDVIITPLDATHTILIKAPEPLMVDIEEQLTLIDAKFESSDKLRKIEMKFANAETVATQLSELFGTGRSSRGSGNRSAQISIRGYKSSGIIYVQAPDEEFERIKATAEDLDKIDTSIQVHRLQLQHAAAQQVLTKIQAMMGEAIRSGAMGNTNLDYVSMQADPRTNSLILVGGPTSALLLGQMLATIDVAQEGINEQETKVYTLPPTINVADIVRNINELFRGVSLTTHGVEAPVVTPNQGSNLIIVRANGKQHEQIERDVVNPVKAEGDKGVRKDNIYVVNNAKAVDLANVLTRHVRETMQQVNRQYPVNIVADEGTNQLIVNATDEDFNKIKPMIEALDQESGERTTEVFKVQYVSPWSMATIINQQFQSRGSRNPNDRVNASFEDGTYSLIVTANKQNMEKVASLIEKADVPSKETVTEFVQLQHGQSDEMRNSIDAALRGKFPSDRRGQMPFNVTSESLSNKLIISAREDIMPEVLEMIQKLDVPGGGELIRKVFKLTYADPGSVSRMIQNLFRPPAGRRSSPREQVQSSDDWTTNSVVVSAVEAKMLEVEQLINEMDQPGDSVRTERVINIENADPNDVAQSLQQILQQRSAGQRGRQSAVIRAVRGTTKIVAYANEKEYESIKSLVEQIDIEGGRIIHAVVIPDQVPARTIADNINNLFGRGRQGGDAPHAESHEPTNTVLVSATDAEFERIQAQLITPLSDSKASGVFSIHYIPVKNAIADEVAQTMQAFFDKKNNVSSNRGFGGRFGGRGGQSNADREDQVTITAEPNSNTLIVYCTDKTKKEIDDLLAVIDSADTTEKRVEMVALQYVDATTMIEILTEVLRVSRTSAKEPDDRPWWARDNDRDDDKDVVLAGDTRLKAITETNSVIVAGKSEAVEDALAKIAELDKPGDTGDTPVPIRLVNTNASTLAETLKQVFVENNRSGSGGRNGKSSGPELTIVPDQSSNTIYVRGKLSDVNKVVEQAKQMDSEASGGESGIVVIPIPFGHDVTDLANMIESQINENEQNEKQKNRNYTPDLVKITPNARTNVLLVNASKSKLEDVKRVIEEMQQQMQFRGGPTRRVLKIENMTPEQAKELIEKVKEGQQSSGSSGNTRRGNRGGRRGDANWTHNRRFDDAKKSASPRRTKRAGTMVAASMPVFLMNVAISTGFAQSDAPKKDDRVPPRSMRIRPQQRDDKKTETNNEPRARKTVASGQPAKPAGRDPRDPNAGQSNAERLIRERAAASSGPRMSDEVLEQLSRRLSGTDINVIEAPDGSLILEGLEQDVDIVAGIIEMVDQQTPLKQIEIVMLKNQLAEPLAQKLTTVFKTLEPPNPRPIDKVDFLADQRTNSIFIAAAPSNMQRAIDLARMADQPSNISRQTKSFVFQNRRVMEVGETIKKIAANYLRQLQLPTDQIQIEIDSFTNQVIVSAGEQDLEFVETIVKTLDMSIDDAEAAEKMSEIGKADVMVVPLRISQAPTLAILINELLTKAATGDTPLKDFIRRFRLLDENGNPIADVNLDRPIAVFGEPESNSLIIASTKENCLVVKQIAMAFDKEPSKAAVTSRVFSLAYADATEVATQLDALLTSSEQITSKASGGGGAAGVPDGPIGALVYKAVVSADARTNQVVVIGRPEAVEAMAGLVAKLDVKGQGVMPFEIVKLNHANASGLATALTDLMDKRQESLPAGGENSMKSETVIIVPDERSVSLIIAAKRERIEELRGLIEKLDIPATALIDNIRTLTLKNSTATDLATKLQDLWSQSEANRDSAQGGLTFETPAIVADERSNSLIIAASESDFNAIKSVVEKIENLELNPMSDIYIVRLKHNSAAELKGPLQTLMDKRRDMRGLGEPRPEDEVSIESDPVNNALIFTASRENHQILVQKITELDQPIGAIPVVEYFACENVYADTVKEAIENLIPDAFRPGAGGDSSVLTARNKVSVVVDNRANMLIVSASPENMEVIRELYRRMNDVTRPWTPVDIQIVELKNTEASQLASKVETWLEQLNTDVQSGTSGGGGSQNQFAVRVIADTVRNWLFVGGTRDGVRQAMDFIAKYDQPIDPNVGPFVSAEVYPLNQAKASQVGEMLRNIFDARNNQSGTGDAAMQPIPVTVEINEPGNSLLINASRQDHLLVKGLLARLDVPSEIPRMFKVYPLSKASATVVKETLDQIYQSSASVQGGGAQGIVTVAEERTNSVVVAVPPGELANVQKLITQLDQIEITEIAEVEVIQCENEDANKMAELLTEIMTGQSAQGGTGSAADAESARQLSSLLVQFEAKDQYGQRDILQTVRENVQISYNERSNSVIVVAPPSSMRLIKKLVQKLDGIQKREVRVKVFPLVNSDAAIMVEKLESMFAQDDSASDQEAFQQGREITVEGGASDVASGPEFAGAGDTRKGTFGRPRTTFVADERTNSIIVAGWPEDIDVAADIIDALDSRDIQERITTVYPLVNMKADEVQGSLDSYFQAQRDALSSVEGQAQLRLLEKDVTVVSHEESNQLIVSSSPRYQSEVLRIIQQLDAPPPQVMIEVMIAEVTLDDSFEMGMEFALQQLKFSETAVAGPNGILQSNSFDFVGGTDLGAAGAGLGGFSFTITGEDFNFLVRALQSDSRLDVIQRPMIMCQNNQTASINIGQQVPFVRGTTVSDNGQTTANIEYEPVGVILNVEPIINPDGFVYMLIEPEVSSITDSSIPLGNGIFAPIISEQKASTTVAVKDGETVVIGGLITTRETESESKVPVLGDMPGIGNLFRTTSRRNTRSELLIAMTPTIIRSVEDARRTSEFQRDLGGYLTPEVKSSPLMRNLQVEPETFSEIDSIESDPGTMKPRVLPSGKPQRIPTQPQRGPSYVPAAPRYGPVVPQSTSGTANVMVRGATASPGAAQASYQRPVTSQRIGTMRPALPTVDQVRSGAAPLRRPGQNSRPVMPQGNAQTYASRPGVAASPVRTYMRLPEFSADEEAARPIVKISTHPSKRSASEKEALRRPAAVKKSNRSDTHR